jgi:hypothetical protein
VSGPIVTSSSAVLSADSVYRYLLTRTWREEADRACFVMLNPSTADADTDDPTIRRCIRFAEAWGFGSLTVVNVFAYRATHPRELLKASDPCGATAGMAAQTIVAWGAHARSAPHLAEVLRAIPSPKCLGLTQCGSPRHPLYVRGDTKPVRYESQV